MCLILFAIDSHPQWPLVIAANRDEFYARPTVPAGPWAEDPGVVAGRDLEAGGTWLGLSRRGRFAAVTNVREADRGPARRSRGELTRRFLLGEESAAEAAARAVAEGADYAGFNLLVADGEGFHYGSNRDGAPARRLARGVYGLANDTLDRAWPKAEAGRDALAALLREGEPAPAALLALLADRGPAAPGTALEEAAVMGSRFIASDLYGTRAATALTVDAAGTATLWEQNYGPRGHPTELIKHAWRLDEIPR